MNEVELSNMGFELSGPVAKRAVPRLVAEVRRLRAAIQEHKRQIGSNAVVEDEDRELWAVLEDYEKPCHVESTNVRAAKSVKVKP